MTFGSPGGAGRPRRPVALIILEQDDGHARDVEFQEVYKKPDRAPW